MRCIVKVRCGMQSAMTLCGQVRRRRRKPAAVLLDSNTPSIEMALKAGYCCRACARVWGYEYAETG